MSHYWKKCPHCGRTIEDGYGSPISRFGNPQRRCRYCQQIYTDRNIVDWESASIFRKILYYFANGRIAICLFPYLITSVVSSNSLKSGLAYLYCLPIFLVLFALCVVYVEIQAKSYYRNDKGSKCFRVLESICDFLSEYLKPIFTIALIIFCVILVIVGRK